MSRSLARVWRVAVMEWSVAVRSRRALVMMLLFTAVAVGVMYVTISSFVAVEQQLVESLGLPESETPGAALMALWKSKPFVRFMEHVSQGSLRFADIRGRHPLLLVYAFFIFWGAPLLTLLVSASRVADDVRSGAARYWLVRVSRTEWSLGKFFGEALMIVTAMLIGGLVAWGVLMWRLPVAAAAPLLTDVLDWSARAGVYAFAWLGVFMGLSHIVKSGGKATALGILAMLGAAAWPVALRNLVSACELPETIRHLDALVPQSAWTLLWRRSPAVFFQGAVHLAALAFFYLALGSAVFSRRDV